MVKPQRVLRLLASSQDKPSTSRLIECPHRRVFPAASGVNGVLNGTHQREDFMLWTICLVLIILWLLGVVTAYTMGGLIHILLVIAIIVVLVRVIQGRKVI